MASTEPTSTMQRKMAAGRDAVVPGARSALRALRLGLARAARDVLEMPVLVIGATQARVSQEGLEQLLSDERLLILLDGPDRAVGAVELDRSTVAALIQHQTMGQVSGGDAVERAFTVTDAALAAPLLDETMRLSSELADIDEDKRCLAGYRFGARAANLRALMLAVDAERFRVFDLTLDFAGGIRQGALRLVLPEAEVVGGDEPAAGAGQMERAVGAAHAELSVNIGRLHLTLAQLSALKVGDVLPLSEQRLDRAEVRTIDGQTVASAHLGQAGGLKAIRLNVVQPEPAVGQPDQGFELGAMPGGVELETAEPDMAAFSGEAAPWDGGGLDLPEAEEEGEAPLPDMSPADAALEISELAGLSEEEEQDWPAMGQGLPALPE